MIFCGGGKGRTVLRKEKSELEEYLRKKKHISQEYISTSTLVESVHPSPISFW